MAKDKLIKKIISRVLLIALIGLPVISGYASTQQNNKKVVLTKQKSVDMALNDNHKISKLDFMMNSIVRQFNNSKKLSDNMDDILDAIDDYEELYKKNKKNLDKIKEIEKELDQIQVLEQKQNEGQTLTQEEQEKIAKKSELQAEKDKLELSPKEEVELETYQKMFGSEPPDYTEEEKFQRFIKPRDFTWYALQGAITQLKMAKTCTEEAIKSGVEQIYDGLLAMEDGLKFQQELYDTQNKEYHQLLIKFENGQVSKLERDVAEIELKKLELSISSFEKQVDNMKMILKQQLGLQASQDVEIKEESKFQKKPLKYDFYLNKALKERAEIESAKIDLDTKQRELDITDDYIDDDEIEWKEVHKNLTEAQMNLDTAIKSVTKDTRKKYMHMLDAKENIDLKYKNLKNMEKMCKDIKVYYEQGMAPISKLWDTEVGYNNAKVDYIKAIRDYKSALNQLETASGIGSSYLPKGGSSRE
ncbi:TolC family protein [Clostridium aestuarii]|uniref:TolC family protein n=1 Tax=Clostridium aestuarii TaxID=338193 RepID=A0ABT4D1W4_9CLOT|nr:TolC family protein [Clostridium aestuarii]MCY6485234.1 TolC family protein [Clostridium aestuarii]